MAPQQERPGLLAALVAGAVIALLATTIYLLVQIDHIKDTTSLTAASHQKQIEALKEQLELVRSKTDQANDLSAEAKLEANAHAEALAKQIADKEAKMKQQVAVQQSEIGDVKQAANAANAKIADVSTDVGGVKSQVAAIQAELTNPDLKSVTGDLGVQSGLVATNAREQAALKRLGERNYIDIRLGKTKQPVRFGDIALLLKNVDVKKNTYSVEVTADDKLTLKENKRINEPVQFYTSKGGRLPYELVINQINKNEIVGYLSAPKETVAR
jgi:acetolactate synthase small subunit